MSFAKTLICAGTVAFTTFAAAPNSSGNWPQWRGPLLTGEAPDANPPTKWSATENIKWKVQVPGEGHATPIIWGKQVFIQTAVPAKPQALVRPNSVPAAQAAPPQGQGQGQGRRGGGGGRGGFGGGDKPTEPLQFTLLSYDRDTGALNWKKIVKEAIPHEGRHGTGTYASPSPVTDGEHVYAFFGSQGIHCYDLQGNLKWSEDLGDMTIKNGFGEGSSPALFGNTLVFLWDHEDADFVTALDKRTGKQLWKTPREEGTAWSTPLVVDHGGKPQVITTATGRIRSYDLGTGEQVWEHAGLTANTIPTPVHANGVVYAMAGFRGFALYAIKLGKTGDLTGTDSVLWNYAKSTPYVPSPLLVGDHLYFTSGNNAILSLFDAKTGKTIYTEERLAGLQGMYASPVAAGGRVYIASQNGATLVIKDSDKLEVLATNQLDDSFNASPAIVGNQLFLRGKSTLYCIAEK